MRSLVVIPTYAEAATIGPVVAAARAAGPDVLVVDDGSPDGTADIVEAAADKAAAHGGPGGIDVLRRSAKEGLGPAYLAGFRWGLDRGYEALAEMDADFSHDPTALPGLFEGLARADLVIGSRYIPGGRIPNWSLHRRLLSRAGNRYSSLVLGLDVADLTSGFRAYRAELLQRLDLDRISAGGYGFQIEMAYLAARAGARIEEVPIAFVDRECGESKMSLRIAVEAFGLVTLWALRDRTDAVRFRGRPARRRCSTPW